MQREGRFTGSPGDWLGRAKSSLALGRRGRGMDDVYWEDMCFALQQAAEKALKAVLVQRKVPYPYTHNLGRLASLLRQRGVDWPEDLGAIANLSHHAVEGRYPSRLEPATEAAYEEALRLAEAVVAWAERELGPESRAGTEER